MSTSGFWLDSSNRLTFHRSCEAIDYAAMSQEIVDAFNLTVDEPLIVGPDQMFWRFRRGDHVIGLDWDIWMEFMVVAHTPSSEPLVRDIAEWVNARTIGKATDAQ